MARSSSPRSPSPKRRRKTEVFTTDNITLAVILGTFAAGAAISQWIAIQLKNIPEGQTLNDNPELKNQIQLMTIVKLGMMVFRLVFGRGLGVGASSISNSVNIIVLFLLQGAASIENVENTLNMLLRIFNQEIDLQLEDFLARLNEIDFWIHILGAANAVTKLPGLVNWILTVAIVATQLDAVRNPQLEGYNLL